MENILQEINRNFISMSEDETRRNKRILSDVLTTFIEKMKEKDPLFKAMYKTVFYGGSFYDGLRVGKAEEFDLDLLLKLPEKSKPDLTTSNIPGFVHLQLCNFDGWMKEETNPAYKNFGKFLDKKHYLCTDKVLAWIQSVIQKTMNDFPQIGNSNKRRILTNQDTFEISEHEGGPARTLKISGSGMKMDVDLVACFVFGPEKWPKNGFRANSVTARPNFFIVPKKPKTNDYQPTPRYWRLSFQEQERVLIDNKKTLKPTVKLLKRLRDTLQHDCIASYYIKTVALHIVDEKNDEFWRSPLSYVFMTVLKEYKRFIEQKRIPYYWNKNNNLLGGIKHNTLDNVNNRLKVVIRDFETKPDIIPGYFDYPANNRNHDVNENSFNTSNTSRTPDNSGCNIF